MRVHLTGIRPAPIWPTLKAILAACILVEDTIIESHPRFSAHHLGVNLEQSRDPSELGVAQARRQAGASG